MISLRQIQETVTTFIRTRGKVMFTKVDKDRNMLTAMNHLVKLKWSPTSAAAIVGNLTQESYLNPETGRGDDGSAMGLAQWRGDRVVKFQEIIGKHCEESSFEEQLNFVNWELRNSNKKAGERLKAAVSLDEKVHMVDKYYERSAGTELDRRIKFANAALAMYQAA